MCTDNATLLPPTCRRVFTTQRGLVTRMVAAPAPAAAVTFEARDILPRDWTWPLLCVESEPQTPPTFQTHVSLWSENTGVRRFFITTMLV